VSADVLYDPEAVPPVEKLFATYALLRDEHPAYLNRSAGFAALTRYADVHRAFSDPVGFSSVTFRRSPHPILAQIDPPRHTVMRKVIARAFTPMRVAALEPAIREFAGGLLDGLLARGTVDLAHEYAAVVPSTVMGRMLGVPAPLIRHFREISDLHMRRISNRDALVPMRMSDELFIPLLEERRAAPTDDLLSALLHAEVDGDRLSEDELLGFCYLLLIGGNDTTTNWIGNALGVILRDPSWRDALVEDRSKIPPLLEEVLRVESPTQIINRRTAADVELHGTLIPAGTRTLLVIGAANRDPRQFDSPEEIRPGRDSSPTVAFGWGIHFCPGATLARLEARVAIEELLRRAPRLVATGKPERVRSSWALGYEHLPARLA